MNKNVMLPLSLMERIIVFMERLDVSDYGYQLRDEYYDLLWALRVKKEKLALRDAYSKIIRAENPDARHEARIQYLIRKQSLSDIVDPPF